MTRVLIIEDEAPIRENIIETLELNNFDVFSADGGETGIEILRNQQVDIVVCDIMMHGIDGFEVLRTVREDLSMTDLPFIFLTALADKQVHERAYQMGVDAFITKPFSYVQLLESIEKLLKKVNS